MRFRALVAFLFALSVACSAEPEPLLYSGPQTTVPPPETLRTGVSVVTAPQRALPDDWQLHLDAEPLDAATTADILAELGLRSETLRLFSSVPALVLTRVPGEEAVERWIELRALVSLTGRWPVMLGGPVELESLGEVAEYAEDPEAVLARAATTTWEAWRAERADYVLTDFGYPESGEPVVASGRAFFYSAHRDVLSGEPLDEVAIALVGTPVPWEVPAHLGWGGWNDNPDATGHVIALRHWHGRYGAEVVSMAFDVVETRVQHPPRTAATALELAREQYLYAYDIVDQGTGDIEVLAGELLDAPGWFFWWD